MSLRYVTWSIFHLLPSLSHDFSWYPIWDCAYLEANVAYQFCCDTNSSPWPPGRQAGILVTDKVIILPTPPSRLPWINALSTNFTAPYGAIITHLCKQPRITPSTWTDNYRLWPEIPNNNITAQYLLDSFISRSIPSNIFHVLLLCPEGFPGLLQMLYLDIYRFAKGM